MSKVVSDLALRVSDAVGKHVRADWFDDQVEEVGKYAAAIGRFGVRASVQSPTVVWTDDYRPERINMVDLDLKNDNFDGITVIKQIVHLRSDARIALVSRYFDLARYDGIHKFIPPSVPVVYIDKSDLANMLAKDNNESRSQTITKATQSVRDALHRIRSMEAGTDPPNFTRLDAPSFVGLSAEDFFNFPPDKQVEMVAEASGLLETEGKRRFDDNPEVAWMVVGVPSGEIIAWGRSDDRVPIKASQVLQLGRNALVNVVPIVLRRPRFDD